MDFFENSKQPVQDLTAYNNLIDHLKKAGAEKQQSVFVKFDNKEDDVDE